MGRLVTILAFALGALLMLESVASDDCHGVVNGYICIIQMVTETSKEGKQLYGQWHKIRGTTDRTECLQGLQTGNPYILRVVKLYHVRNCRRQRNM